ncbi:MAG: AmmeMemoRadiSam system protein B [Bacteroidales bacterium]|nr:AmmeMemoRadiSam system protein B [Bacteroidales bacterium]
MKSFIAALLILGYSLLSSACNTRPKPVVSPDKKAPQQVASANDQDRQPAVAGSFYPASEEVLRKDLEALFASVEKVTSEHVRALIVPHAGYVYSGKTAAAGFKQLDRDCRFERVFLIGSSHRMYFQGASVYTDGDFITPLGRVKVDPLAKELASAYSVFTDNPAPHLQEHSLEVELPFLQYWLNNEFTLVPIVLGGDNLKDFREIAEILEPWFNEKNLFVISSDFSHYPGYEDARTCDAEMANAILKNSAQDFLKAKTRVENRQVKGLVTAICGWASVYTLLNVTEDNASLNFQHLLYENSGDSPQGTTDRVVGYHAIAITSVAEKKSEPEFTLTREEKIKLLKIARQTLADYIPGKLKFTPEEKDLTPLLKTGAGAFVTLEKNGQLRGCIGNFQASQALYLTVRDMAIAAATQDHRFPAVEASEIPKLDIEISVLTPMRKINSIDEIELGKHGIYIRKGSQTGTFLPQVATETGWTLEEFLGHCARDKAGIGWDGWKTADIYVYEALVFSEHEPDLK